MPRDMTECLAEASGDGGGAAGGLETVGKCQWDAMTWSITLPI